MKDQKNISLRLNDSTRKKLKYVAEYDRRSMQNLVQGLVQDYIREFEKTNGPIRPEDLEALGND